MASYAHVQLQDGSGNVQQYFGWFGTKGEVFVEFRAGKMVMDGARVNPDTRKGLVRIGRGEEGLVHFQWIDRAINEVQDDQIIFPDEAVFEKVNQSSGRVYILKFRTDDRKFFFWMQEPKAETDTQLCNSVNFYLNQPLELAAEDEPDASVPAQSSEVNVEDDISSRAGNLVSPSMGVEASSDVTSTGRVTLEDLQRFFNDIRPLADESDPDAGFGLSDILRPEFLLPHIQELSANQGLVSHLPEGKCTPDELIELLQSPLFRQQLDSFTYVLRTGQVEPRQFGIDPSKFKFTVPSFLEALEDAWGRNNEESTQGGSDLRSQTCQGNDTMDEGA